MQIFDLLDYLEIIDHLKTNSKIYKQTSNKEWIQILCPYCDDAYRKTNINHGHFYIARYFNFCQCFRCETKKSIKQFLLDTGFNNKLLLKNIFKQNYNISYNKETTFGHISNIDIISKHIKFKNQFPNKYKQFLDYLINRVGDINFKKFKVYPEIINNKLVIVFNNYLNEISTIRFIDENNIKYFKLKNNTFYYFQDIDYYPNIVICEGVFDLINLYKYNTLFNNDNTFYVALNGRSYISDIIKIILDNYMIGKYIIHIIFDKNVNNIEKIKFSLESKISLLNSNIKIKYYSPTILKDVSEFNLIELI